MNNLYNSTKKETETTIAKTIKAFFDQRFLKIVGVLMLGVLFHFLIHTIVVWWFSLDVSAGVWLWKEILISVLWLLLWWVIVTKLVMKETIWLSKFWWWFVAGVLFLLIWWAIVWLLIHGQWLMDRVVMVKYDLFPLVALVVIWWWGSLLAPTLSQATWLMHQLGNFWYRVMQCLLVVSLVWRWWVNVSPALFDVLWYSVDAFEWVGGEAPPIRYLTNVWWWYVRNQSILWWPVSLWFLLVWLFAWFVDHTKNCLTKNSSWFVRWWVSLYVVVVITTFSRAAWWITLIQILVLLWLRGYQKQWKYWLKLLVSVLVWVVVGVVWIQAIGPADVVNGDKHETTVLSRWLSDAGHEELLLQWVAHAREYRLRWTWLISVWPASLASEDGYNPENQYLQIWLELWLLWLFVYLWLYLSLFFCLWNHRYGKWLAIWLAWLWVAWMVLHPLIDSQVMYLLMIMIGNVLRVRE